MYVKNIEEILTHSNLVTDDLNCIAFGPGNK